MDQFSGPRRIFPLGVITPTPQLVGNILVHPQPYHATRFPPAFQSNPQHTPHYYHPNSGFSREDEYIPNLPQPLLYPRPPPPPQRYPLLTYRASTRPSPPSLIGDVGNSEQRRVGGENRQPLQEFNHYGRDVPPAAEGVASRYHAPPSLRCAQRQQPSGSGGPTRVTRSRGPIQEPPPPVQTVEFKNGFPVIPFETPPRPPQPIENEGFVPDSEEKEDEAPPEISEEKRVASGRFKRNETLMKLVLDQRVVDCEPDFGAIKRVVSLKRQVVLLQTEVEKEAERCDRVKKTCQHQLASFKESTAQFHQAMAFFNMQNYDEISAEMEQKFYLEMKEQIEQQPETWGTKEPCNCDDKSEEMEPSSHFNFDWKEGISYNNVINWTSLTPEKCPIYEAHKFIYRISEYNKEYHDLRPGGCYSLVPRDPPPSLAYQQAFHLANPISEPVAQHFSEYSQPQVAAALPQQPEPPAMTQLQQLEIQQNQREQQQQRIEIDKELEAARLKLRWKCLASDNLRIEQQNKLQNLGENRGGGEPGSSGMGSSTDFPISMLQRQTNNWLMSGGGVIEVKKSKPTPPEATATTPTYVDLYPDEGHQENINENYNGGEMYSHHQVQVEPSTSSPTAHLESPFAPNAPILNSLLEEIPRLDLTRMWNNSCSQMGNSRYSSFSAGGAAYQGAEFGGGYGLEMVDGYYQNGNVLQNGNEDGGGVGANSDENKDGNYNGANCDKYCVPEAIEEIIISDSADEVDDNGQ
ncbi:unnamed protein product [Orchesella dallaii]|uniref:Uncharacterized protein n=1 Tax=Orchesella dallaii TaxID=48710 RepID=A0ABP1QYD8_9HEXA